MARHPDPESVSNRVAQLQLNENILLKPGSFVKFNAISLFEFEKLNKQ